MRSKFAKAQIKFLEILKQNGLLDLALEGKLPPHVIKAAKQVVVCDMEGEKTSEDRTTLTCTADEHVEAENEIDEFLKFYKLNNIMKKAAKTYVPRTFSVGRKYVVANGYFKGRTVCYRGTDLEVFGCDWMDNPGHPTCERFLFRAQRDGLSVNLPTYVFSLSGENRDILLQASEIGMEVI